jgi:hypothetical protein
MPKTDPDPALDPPRDLTDDPDAYEAPPDLSETQVGGSEADVEPRRPRSAALRLAALIAVVLAVAGGLLAYRAHHRGKVLAQGLARAEALLRLDTSVGYRDAASLLEPLAQMDPAEAGSVRAFALAMLIADYRAADLEPQVDALLVAPGRAEVVPAHAHLATAALALGRREVGNASTAATRAGSGAWARALQARVALAAGNAAAALDPAAAAASEGAFAPGLALHGDALRRLRTDPRGARAAYEAALVASPLQPRAAFGLAKLALGGQAPPDGAAAALGRLLADTARTPAQERARAALHLAALRLRAGNRAGAVAALDSVALDGPARAWAERAAAVAAESEGPYRAVAGAPAALASASDDDPGELSPRPPPPPAAGPKVVAKPAVKAKAPAKKATAKAATAKKPAAAAKKPSGSAKSAATKKAATAAKNGAAAKKTAVRKTRSTATPR